MTYADVVNQMQTVQARMQLIQQLISGTSATRTSSTSASTFASALDDATATDAATPAAATASPTARTAATASTGPVAASTDGTTVDANGATGDDVVQAALGYVGTPYVLGGDSTSGIDCSGLVQQALKSVGVTAPRLVHEQETIGQKVDSLKDAQPGDLIVLNGGDHIAIYMGNDTVIHAPYAGRTVSVQKAWFDDSDITTIRRVVPATDDATSSASSLSALAGGMLGTSTSTATSGLSASTTAKATSMLTTYGSDVGLYSSEDGGTSLSSLLSSFGLGGTSSSTSSSSTAMQQLIAARSALVGASAS